MAENPIDSVPAASQSTAKANKPAARNSGLGKRLPERLRFVARRNGLDGVENAICAVSDAIANRASGSMSYEELQTAVVAIATMASAMKRIAQSCAMVSVAHRSYAEGDKLLAEAERDHAEAKKLQAETAMLVEKRGSNAAIEPYDAEEAKQGALAALWGQARRSD